MMDLKIELKNIGRQKYCETWTIFDDDINQAENEAYQKATSKLMSRDTCMELKEQVGNVYHYNVFAGFRSVGDVIITEIKEKNKFNGIFE